MRDLGVNSSHYLIYLEPYDRIYPFDKLALAFILSEKDRYCVLPQGEGEEDVASLVFMMWTSMYLNFKKLLCLKHYTEYAKLSWAILGKSYYS